MNKNHEHQFSCTCCHGATCPLHDEGIRHCIICDKIITDDVLSAGENDEKEN